MRLLNGHNKKQVTTSIETLMIEKAITDYKYNSIGELGRIIWTNPLAAGGWGLTHEGYEIFAKLFDKWELPVLRVTGEFLVKLDTTMPWPYRLGVGNTIVVFDEEVSTAALLYGDIDSLLNAYKI